MINARGGERALADKGYADPNYFIFPQFNVPNARHKLIMARHETVNRRLKQFGVLGQVFRHKLQLHPRCFKAVINLTELMIENGEPLFDV
jgi:hypothetical protein